MKPVKIKLRGAIGIKEGLGLDEIELDLSDVGGLVVLDGTNGRGKSTLLDNLHPYRTLPSRKRALQHHFFLSDSYRDLTMIDAQGKSWRFLLKIDGPRGKQEGYIYEGDSTSSLVGSLKEYDAKVSELMGSVDLFLSSVFAAQRQDDGDMTVGQLRGQLAEYLNLQAHQRRSESAKKFAGILKERIEVREKEASGIDERLSKLQNSERERQEKLNELAIVQNRSDLSEHERTDAKKDLDDLYAQNIENEKLKVKKSSLEERLQSAKAELINLQRQARSEQIAIDLKIQDLNDIMGKCDQRLSQEAEISEANDKIALINMTIEAHREHKRRLEQESGEIRSAIDELQDQSNNLIASHTERLSRIEEDHGARLEALQREKDTHSSKIDDLEAKRSYLEKESSVLESKSRMLEIEIKGLSNDERLTALESQRQIAQAKIEAMRSRMDPKCASDVCGFPADARQAEKDLPGIIESIETIQGEITEKEIGLKQQIAGIKTKIEQIELSAKILNDQYLIEFDASVKAGADINSLSAETSSRKKTADAEYQRDRNELAEKMALKREDLRKNTISQSKRDTSIEDALQEIESLKALAARKDEIISAKAEKTAAEQTLEKAMKEKDELKSRHEKAIESKGNDILKIDSEIISITIDEQLPVLIHVRQKEIENFDRQINELNSSAADIHAQISYLQNDIEQKAALEESLTSLTNHIAFLNNEMAQWRYIEAGLGPNGLQALETELATPIICGVANELLSEGFGVPMQVKMKTLSDAGKETLQIWVIKENGTETMLDDLSGGERVWILKAMRLSRLIMAKENSGYDYLAAFGDEEDGALRHGALSESFISLYETFRRRAGFDVCYYISHKKECIAMADRVIQFHRAGDPRNGDGVFDTDGVTIQ